MEELKKQGFIVEGKVCDPEEVKTQVKSVRGVSDVQFDPDTLVGFVTFDPDRTDIDAILYRIEEKDYACFILDEGQQKEYLQEAEPVAEEKDTQTQASEPVVDETAESAVQESEPTSEPVAEASNQENNDSIVTISFIAEGTTCNSCAEIIKRQARKVNGVKDVEFDYSAETGSVTFDSKITDIDTILYKIEKKGYTCSILEDSKKNIDDSKKNKSRWLGWVLGIVGVLVAGYFLLGFIDTVQVPQISPGMGYGLLFLVGILTGFHCIAMCGGFVVSYSAKDAQEGRKSHKSHLMYGLGKTVSYTVIGAIFGLIGSVIAFTPKMRGVAGLLAGLFLILFGLKMLNIFPALRKINFTTPRFIAKFVGEKSAKSSSPLVLGLLNGLMIACGPLQAVYIMAAGTGSWIEGGKLLFVFALGTLPVMLGFGYFTSFISSKMTQKILKASGALVIILGLVMLNNGLTLAGSGLDVNALASGSGNVALSGQAALGVNDVGTVVKDGYQEIRMTVGRGGFTPNTFVLKKGVPVRWIIEGKELNGCNSGIIVPDYGLDFKVKPGEQTIEFTPDKEGTIRWSCWMGMIRGTFIVKGNIDLSDKAAVQKEIDSAPKASGGGSCGGGGGGCGCGG